MNTSIYWDALTDIQRQVLSELGLYPGAKFYIRKRRSLTDAVLQSRLADSARQGLCGDQAIDAIALEFKRTAKTVAARAKRLMQQQLQEVGR